MKDKFLYRIRYYRFRKVYITGLIALLVIIGFGAFYLTDKESFTNIGDKIASTIGGGNIEDEVSKEGDETPDTSVSDTVAVDVVKPGSALDFGVGGATEIGGYTYFTQSKIALLSDTNLFIPSRVVGTRGCGDVVVMSEIEFPATTMPLNASLSRLFDLNDPIAFIPGNFIGTQKDLRFSHATIDNGVARVYLTGEHGPIAGVCDEPRTKIQIEETALQFSTVKSVEIYLNGERY